MAVNAPFISKRGDYCVLITVSVFWNSVPIGHFMKWLAVKVVGSESGYDTDSDDSDVD